jgi:hypothetical protein
VEVERVGAAGGEEAVGVIKIKEILRLRLVIRLRESPRFAQDDNA